MSRPFEVRLPLERAYVRNVLFAVELLDAVTLARVSQGVKVLAEGLQGTPFVNASGLFVWLNEDIGPLRKITIDPGILPYESVECAAADLQRPLTTIELPPRVHYPFRGGITGLRGTLVEERTVPPERPVPVPNAEVRLRWLDEDGVTWRDAPTASRTAAAGDFAAIMRLAPTQVPRPNADGTFTVRLRARRPVLGARDSDDLQLLQGRVADPSTFPHGPDALTFVWDELQP